MRVLSTELGAHVGERVTLAGWLHAKRELGSVSFAVVRDRAGLAQVVVDPSNRLLLSHGLETVLELEGLAVGNEQAPGGVELHEPSFRVLAEPAEAPPIELRRPELKETLPVQLDFAPVALRHPLVRERFRIAAAAVHGFRAALDGIGFTEISTPKLVASATESGANVFSLDYFGREAFLAQSPQFYKQTMVGVFERVYETGHVFRAEPHEDRKSTRLNSSHSQISYAVFCLKKKKDYITRDQICFVDYGEGNAESLPPVRHALVVNHPVICRNAL